MLYPCRDPGAAGPCCSCTPRAGVTESSVSQELEGNEVSKQPPEGVRCHSRCLTGGEIKIQTEQPWSSARCKKVTDAGQKLGTQGPLSQACCSSFRSHSFSGALEIICSDGPSQLGAAQTWSLRSPI